MGDLEPAPPVDLSLMARPERYDIFCWSASRGCPFHCAFCTETLTAPRYSPDGIDKIAADAAAFGESGQRWYLWVCDPLFGAGRRRTAAVSEALGSSGLEFLAESRVDVLHPDDVPGLREAGCNLVYFGLEAVSHRSLLELRKLPAAPARHRRYLERTRALVEACLRSDVLPVLGVVVPVPGDTAEDLDQTLTFLGELADLGRRVGGGPDGIGPCFHAFPLRFDRGAPYDNRMEEVRAAGATISQPEDALFDWRFIERASPTVDAAAGERFREAVRALNPTAPAVRQRLLRSFPRPYMRVALN